MRRDRTEVGESLGDIQLELDVGIAAAEIQSCFLFSGETEKKRREGRKEAADEARLTNCSLRVK